MTATFAAGVQDEVEVVADETVEEAAFVVEVEEVTRVVEEGATPWIAISAHVK